MYSAIIAAVATRPHPNADRLQLGTTAGHQVIVGMDVRDGDVGIFFPADGQLSLEYCIHNHLLKTDGGYFDINRRVRAQTFRGEKSEGLWMPLSSLSFLEEIHGDLGDLPLGHQFTLINGYEICGRYETPSTKRAQGTQKQGKPKPVNIYFKKHIDTAQWRFFKDQIPDNAFVSITEKLHGTSGRYGRVLTTETLPLWKLILNVFYRPENQYVSHKYEYLIGTRNTILDSVKLAAGTSYYGKEGFRFQSVQGISLYEGETLYFELVGYTETGAMIMPEHPVKDKELALHYGDKIKYSYGQNPGTVGLYVYRITRTSPEGITTELSWNQVKERCNELGIKYTPELNFLINNGTPDSNGRQINLEEHVSSMVEGPSVLDQSHIREGVVIRVESEKGTQWYKEKSFTFKVLEGIIKDQDDYVDTEEAS